MMWSNDSLSKDKITSFFAKFEVCTDKKFEKASLLTIVCELYQRISVLKSVYDLS